MDTLMELKTNPKLLSSLKDAASKKQTVDEIREQKVSFVYGSLSSKSAVTREQVRQLLVDREGVVVA